MRKRQRDWIQFRQEKARFDQKDWDEQACATVEREPEPESETVGVSVVVVDPNYPNLSRIIEDSVAETLKNPLNKAKAKNKRTAQTTYYLRNEDGKFAADKDFVPKSAKTSARSKTEERITTLNYKNNGSGLFLLVDSEITVDGEKVDEVDGVQRSAKRKEELTAIMGEIYGAPAEAEKPREDSYNEMNDNINALKASLPIKIWETQKKKPDLMRIDNIEEATMAYEQIYAKDSEKMAELVEEYNNSFVGPQLPNQTLSPNKKALTNFLKSKDVTAFDLLIDDMDNEELLKYTKKLSTANLNNESYLEEMLESLLTSMTQDDTLKPVAKKMFERFKNGTGGEYSHPALTAAVLKHSTTKSFIKNVEQIVENQLESHNFVVDDNFTSDAQTSIQNGVSLPSFGLSTLNEGLTILLHGFWDANITLTELNYNSNTKTAKVKLKYTLRDHFGLDIDDIKNNKPIKKLQMAIKGEEFSAWFILQHSKEDFINKWEPFNTLVEFEEEFETTKDNLLTSIWKKVKGD
jgi:hypothetical protein